MNLQNIRVLVDGYNLELLQGTGIKTYGISLIKALNSFQADINVLYSKEIKLTKNTPVAEVLFFDPNFQKIGLKTKIIAIAKIITRLSF